MSDYTKDPSLEEFIDRFSQDLENLNEKNTKSLAELTKENDIPVKKVLTEVYNDFFGPSESNITLSTETKKDSAAGDGSIKKDKPVSDMSLEEILQDLKKEAEDLEKLGVRNRKAGGDSLDGQNTNTGSSAGNNGAGPNSSAGNPGNTASNANSANTGTTSDGTNDAAAQTGTSSADANIVQGEPEKSGMEQLNELTGLKNIKHDVAELVALAKVRKMREEKGLKYVPTSLHLVFSGNPGTGKTTVARILAKLYKEIGILSKGQLVEVDRSALVAGYVGQTAIKTQEKIKEALGGILFVDEAYTLVRNEGNDFGQEAIDTILKAMEDHRDDLIVIVAGYTDLMKNFIDSNPGLKSRFNKYIYFEDYTAEELQSIFESNCKKYSYTLTPEAKITVNTKIAELVAKKDKNFANAREIRNLFEEIVTNQASRVSLLEAPTEEDLMQILPEDLEDNMDFGVENNTGDSEPSDAENTSFTSDTEKTPN